MSRGAVVLQLPRRPAGATPVELPAVAFRSPRPPLPDQRGRMPDSLARRAWLLSRASVKGRMGKFVSRRQHHALRVREARRDTEVAKELLREFAALAVSDPGNLDPHLVRYVAARVRAWSKSEFSSEAAARAFRLPAPTRGRPASAATKDKHASILAEVYRQRLAGTPLPVAFETAADQMDVAASTAKDIYEQPPHDVVVAAVMSLSAQEREAVADLMKRPRVGRPRKR